MIYNFNQNRITSPMMRFNFFSSAVLAAALALSAETGKASTSELWKNEFAELDDTDLAQLASDEWYFDDDDFYAQLDSEGESEGENDMQAHGEGEADSYSSSEASSSSGSESDSFSESEGESNSESATEDEGFAEIGASSQLQFDDMYMDAADLLMQVAVDEGESLTTFLAQAKAIADEFVQGMPADELARYNNMLSQVTTNAFSALANAKPENQFRFAQMLADSNYGEMILAQIESPEAN